MFDVLFESGLFCSLFCSKSVLCWMFCSRNRDVEFDILFAIGMLFWLSSDFRNVFGVGCSVRCCVRRCCCVRCSVRVRELHVVFDVR